MNKNINAVIDKWIPVLDGKASLLDIFKNEEGSSFLSGNSWERIPVLNLLVCIATAATRPKTNSDILSFLNDRDYFCDKVKEYLDEWEDSFWLHHEFYPLFQVAFMDSNYPLEGKGFTRRHVSDLIFGEGQKTVALRTGSDPDAIISPEDTLLALLNSQVIGGNMKYGFKKPGGPNLIPSGQVQGFQTAVPVTISTNGGSTSTLNLRVTSKNLIETIILNMISEEDIKTVFGVYGFGHPYWEYDVWTDHKKMLGVSDKLTESFLGRLIPITKFLWVDPDKTQEIMYADAEGLDYQPYTAFLKETTCESTYYFPNKDTKAKASLKAFDPDSYLWQDFASLDIGHDCPLVLKKFKLDYDYSDIITVDASALQVSNSMGLVSKVNVMLSSVTWFNGCISKYINGNVKLDQHINIAKDICFSNKDKPQWNIGGALHILAKELNLDSKGSTFEGLKDSIRKGYWLILDREFPLFLKDIDNPNTLQEWKNFCEETAKRLIMNLSDSGSRRNRAVVIACTYKK